MGITKEKIVCALALLVSLGASFVSYNNYKLPGSVPEPAEEEKAFPYESADELLPVLQARSVWKGEGRNPFEQRDGYAEQAPVPLALPPKLEFREFLPNSIDKRRFGLDSVEQLKTPATNPEPKVNEPAIQGSQTGDSDGNSNDGGQ